MAICICNGSVLIEIMSYCDILEPSHVLTVEGDSATSSEGLDLVCMLTKPCRWVGDLLPFSQIPDGRAQCCWTFLYLIQNPYINCSMVTGSFHTWEEHKWLDLHRVGELYWVYGRILLVCLLLLFTVFILDFSCSLTTFITTSYILHESQYLQLGQNLGSLGALKEVCDILKFPNRFLSSIGVKQVQSLFLKPLLLTAVQYVGMFVLKHRFLLILCVFSFLVQNPFLHLWLYKLDMQRPFSHCLPLWVSSKMMSL